MAISFVANSYTETTTSGTSFSLTKPTGTTAGDLLIGFLAVNLGTSGAQVGVTVPSGWTLVRTVYRSGTYPSQITVMKRTAEAGDGATYAGSIASSKNVRICSVSGFRGADTAANQFIAENGSSTASDASYSTATVNNTDSDAWAVVAATYNSASAGAWSISSLTERRDDNAGSPDVIGFVCADSNAGVATGNRSYTVNKPSSGYDSSASWIGLIKPASEAPHLDANAGTAEADSDAHNAAPSKASQPSPGGPGASTAAHNAAPALASSPGAGDAQAAVQAHDATVTTDSTALPEGSAAAGLAFNAAVELESAPEAGAASGTASAHDAAGVPGVLGSSGAPAVSATAHDAGTLLDAGPEAGSALVGVQAHDATVAGDSTTLAPASGASAAVSAYGAVIGWEFATGGASASATAYDAGVALGAGGASATATAHDAEVEASEDPDPEGDAAGSAVAHCTAYDAVFVTAVEALADGILAEATAHDASVETSAPLDAEAEFAAVGATAHDAGVVVQELSAGVASAAVFAHNATVRSASVGRVSVGVAAHNASVNAIGPAAAPSERTFAVKPPRGRIYYTAWRDDE